MFRRWKTLAAIMLAAGLTLCAVVHAARVPKSAPEIFGIDPGEGPAGSTIKVTGTGFERTRYVLFAAGSTGQQAKFKVVSDKELEVTAPNYLKEGTSATVVVVTWSGAAVGVPASVLEVDSRRQGGAKTASFYHVFDGGVLGASHGIVVVDEGGIATASDKSAICFVKNGGMLRNTDHFSGLVIHERDAVLQTTPQPYNPLTRLLQVPVITASPGVEPFVFQRPENPGTRAQSPPNVSSVAPGIVPKDGILTLKGTGFSETSEVLFVGDGADHDTSADFRVVSDEELHVQVPEQLLGAARLVIINPRGATLVVAQNDVTAPRGHSSIRTVGANAGSKSRSIRIRVSANPVIRVTKNAVVSDAGSHGVYFVEAGGRVIHTGGSSVYFVKNRGKVEGSGGRTFVVREPQADASLDAGRRHAADRDVESLSLSIVPTMFTIVPP